MAVDRTADLVPDVWRHVTEALDQGDQESAARLAKGGLADIEVTIGAAVTFLDRGLDYLGAIDGGDHAGAVWELAPISPDDFNGVLVDRTIGDLRSLVEQPPTGDVGRAVTAQLAELKRVHNHGYDMVALLLTYAADTFGEDIIEGLWRHMMADAWKIASERASLPLEERIRRTNRMFEAEFGGPASARQEGGRYEVTHSPCGTGGRMRTEGGFGGTMQFGRTRRAYSWSWGKEGVPYYCTHCCILWEIDQIDALGHPLRIHEGMDDPQQPIRHLYFDDPKAVPAEYYHRVDRQPPG